MSGAAAPPDDARPVAEFPRYRVSRCGGVWAAGRGGGFRRLTPQPAQNGHLKVWLTEGDRRKKFGVHVLVALAFIGPRPSPGMIVAHDDGDPTNNAAENLAWKTERENAADRDRHGRTYRGERNPGAKLTAARVLEIRSARATGERLHVIAERFGVAPSTVRRVVARRNWRHV